jgi:dTDP-4-amino-4,6-dideoxygalactose transaminase
MINVTKTTLPEINHYIKYLKKIWKTSMITNHGEYHKQLQDALKIYLNVKHILPISNGTIAIKLACKVLDVKNEVITTAFTFPATTNVLLWQGLKPVFADIDKETFNINPSEIEKKITPRTTAILAVHVFGNPCNVEQIEKIAKKHNLKVIYDAAHAFGVEYKGKSLLRWGDISTLSFHATKVFHTIEGGAVISKTKASHDITKLLVNHGIADYEKVVLAGTNAKMNEFQAIMGLCVLEKQEQGIKKRKKIYETYISAFSLLPNITTQKLMKGLTKYTYPYFPVCFTDEKTRDRIYKMLLKNGIRARKYFYPPSHELPYIKVKGNDLVNSTKISHTILCLPIYPTLAINDVKKIISIIRDEVKSK